jgi:uncharacterized protein (DUF488 family)
MKFDNIIIDASSIINFFKYYHRYFLLYNTKDRKPEFNIIFNGLKDFLIDKINSGEIIVLDKVNNELRSKDFNVFKDAIKNSIIDSLIVFDEVGDLIDKYRILENEKFYNDDPDKINAELELYETKYADLFLVAYANKIKQEGKKVLVITEETFREDGKLIPKIPEICKKDNEKIFCRNLPYTLFEFYKDELDFTLEIKPK